MESQASFQGKGKVMFNQQACIIHVHNIAEACFLLASVSEMSDVNHGPLMSFLFNSNMQMFTIE